MQMLVLSIEGEKAKPTWPYVEKGNISQSLSSWCLSPVYGWEVVYTLDRSLVYHRATQTHNHSFVPKGNLEEPINLTVMFLDFGRKVECPERTYTCKLHVGVKPRIFLLQGNSATNCATMQPC
ncbi:hypothetical protein ATANTOWER_000133 [Ataeniobius toweri]|uniref:Uncharacterized protein n=1 Tax=Ataeniobius toweri TaxID=208326 RepID=A0ABU7BCS7_9TELE|nr:hypothetical protein [Ataeniobius toweri]